MALVNEYGDLTPKGWTAIILSTLVGVIGITFLFSTFEVIETGERGVVLEWGKFDRILDEGFHVVNPISSDVITLPIRVQKVEVDSSAASKDLQSVAAKVVLNFYLDPIKVGSLYQKIGRDYAETIISPAIQESVKAGTALFTAEELVSKREAVKEKIKNNLTERLANSYIIVTDFSIVNFNFSSEFNAAIEAKQVAEQKALQAENDLKRITTEAQQSIEKAKAEAESTRLQSQALQQSSSVIELRKVEALLEFAKKWDGKLPNNLITGGAGISTLNLNDFLK